MQKFLDKYKVLITAMIGAIAIAFQQFVGQPDVSWKALGIAALVAATGVWGNKYRGQYPSMVALIGVAVMTIKEVTEGGSISWEQVAISFVVAVGSVALPAPKPRSYEHDPMIENAKSK